MADTCFAWLRCTAARPGRRAARHFERASIDHRVGGELVVGRGPPACRPPSTMGRLSRASRPSWGCSTSQDRTPVSPSDRHRARDRDVDGAGDAPPRPGARPEPGRWVLAGRSGNPAHSSRRPDATTGTARPSPRPRPPSAVPGFVQGQQSRAGSPHPCGRGDKEGAVDFEQVERQIPQARQRGAPRPEIIDGHPDADASQRLEDLDQKKIARGVVGQGQRITTTAVPRPEPTLEIDAPALVRCLSLAMRPRPLQHRPAATGTGQDQATPLEQIADRAGGRPGLLRRTPRQHRLELLRPPMWSLLP